MLAQLGARKTENGAMFMAIFHGTKDHFVARFWEWLLAGTLFVAAFIYMGTPEEYFTSPAYRLIRPLASAHTWGSLLLAVSVLRITALTLNGTLDKFKRLSPPVRSITSLISAISWCFITVSMFQSDGNFMGNATYSALVIGEMYLFVTVADEAAIIERDYRAVSGPTNPIGDTEDDAR